MLFVGKFRYFLLLVIRLASRMLQMAIARVWNLLSGNCPKISLFFACSFKVGFLKSTNGVGYGLGLIFCYVSQSFAVFC